VTVKQIVVEPPTPEELARRVASSVAVRAIRLLGQRAVRACDLAAGGGEWTPGTVLEASRGLEQGLRSVGVQRRWPRLAASLKRIGAQWAASKMQVAS
jgi:hypothetical protein